MTKIDIFSGFLGAGKTTLIKKLMEEAYKGEKLVLIENEFGEIGIDGGFLQEAGVEITEMNSGCICCSLVGDFAKALAQVMETYAPDRILIEPSGVGKLSDVISAVQGLEMENVVLNGFTTVADANKCKLYMKNFGEFYNNQVEHASTIVLSRTQGMKQDKLDACVALLREKNPTAVIVTTPWDQLTGAQLLEAIERKDTLAEALELLEAEHKHHHDHEHEHHHHEHGEECCCGHHDHEHEHHHHEHGEECCCGHHDHEHEHHHHEHGEECCCGHHDHEHEHHHHEHGEECCCGHHDHEHEHHHHEHGEECCCGHHDHEHEHHHHHHEHGEECSCGCGGHHDHHHHHADEVFSSWGKETSHIFNEKSLLAALEALDENICGQVLRAKGIVAGEDGWLHFDYVPGEAQVRHGAAAVIGRLCVIGVQLDEAALTAHFGL